jgi:regulatory protein
MALTNIRPSAPQLNNSSLQELALNYVGKYATTRSKLRVYLSRKLRERGWDGDRDPDIERLADRLAELGYIDDAAYALSKSRSLSARGYGKRRLADKLKADGIDDDDRMAADAHADEQALSAALRFAERRRIGAFSPVAADHRQREKWVAAMVRAGHAFRLSRAIAALEPGVEIDEGAFNDYLTGSNF